MQLLYTYITQILSSFSDGEHNAFHVHRTSHVLARDDIIHQVTI